MSKLTIGTRSNGTPFSMPIDFVTQTAAVLARKRVGKTYTASVIAEELCKAGQPFVALDPTGAWWGLRSHYPVIIIGGANGDVPLETSAGAVIADLVVEHPGFYVIDLSQTESDAEQDRFACDFATRLYRIKEKNRFPLHLFVDEADCFAPQRPFPNQTRMLGAFEAIVRRGGIRGLGMTMITQRPAVLNKNVLTQCEVLVVLQMTAPNDQDAINDWVKRNGTAEECETMMDSLASLQVGDAWIWSPSWLQVFEKIKIRTRETFNSSATPKVGEEVVKPRKMMAVDLAALGERIKATVEQSKANDPKELKNELAALKAQLTAAQQASKTAEVPVLDLGSRIKLDAMQAEVELMSTRAKEFAEAIPRILAGLEYVRLSIKPQPAKGAPAIPYRPVQEPRVTVLMKAEGSALTKAERSILTALAQFGTCTKNKLAAIAGYAVNGGGFNNALGSLRSAGSIVGSDPIEATQAGREALGVYSPLPTGPELVRYWIAKSSKAEAAILTRLSYIYPSAVSKIILAEQCGYQATGGGFNNALGALRTLELITRGDPIKLSDNLFA